MGFIEKIMGGGGKKRVNYGLTQLGTQKAENAMGDGVKLKVLSDLQENGTSSVYAVAERTGINHERVKALISNMESEGWVKKVQGDV